jgi:hypothetical protein
LASGGPKGIAAGALWLESRGAISFSHVLEEPPVYSEVIPESWQGVQ